MDATPAIISRKPNMSAFLSGELPDKIPLVQIVVYILYGLLLLAFLIFAGFAVRHAFNYSYISPRIKIVSWIFVFVSAVLIGISLYFLAQLQL